MTRNFGKQPAHRLIMSNGAGAIKDTAEAIGVERWHLVNVLRGKIRPNAIVREQLPIYLGVPLEELFTEESLNRKKPE